MNSIAELEERIVKLETALKQHTELTLTLSNELARARTDMRIDPALAKARSKVGYLNSDEESVLTSIYRGLKVGEVLTIQHIDGRVWRLDTCTEDNKLEIANNANKLIELARQVPGLQDILECTIKSEPAKSKNLKQSIQVDEKYLKLWETQRQS
jgi:hypothetical protein